MKRNLRRTSGLAALLLALALLAGCTQSSSVPTASPAADPSAQQTEQTGQREITDMAGRTMTVPEEIQSAFSTGPVSAIYLYTLVPDKLLGWNYELNDIEKSIILPEYHDLPNFGMGDSVNYEAVIAAGPTIAFHVSAINEETKDEADQLSQQLGIPVVMVSSELEDAAEVYRFMGELFGVEEQAEALAEYAEAVFADVAAIDVSEEEKVRVYYGNGENSLETAPAGSSHGAILDAVKAVNVADLELGDGSRVQISLEQLLAWDPDVIVVNGEPKSNMSGGAAAQSILSNPDFATLKAVQEGKVYGTPNAPFSWVDRPPGPNRLVGIRWLAGLLYPDRVPYDVDEEVKEFFQLFYHVDLSEEQLAQLYAGTI
ncbi:ABC transporter substrate-binding protein [Pseudoflavonifractor sp. MCC625]|uniref:ABC transporter substrate-binding protein n=1 Tax=Pseudoflavonifractor sp. MCC625 TaxID=2592647 RepID=UPI0020788075|nr:ABC transporter substrate-binding protein [Pseudoflavonifractor sp. MCC625]